MIYREVPFTESNMIVFKMYLRLDPVKNMHIRSVQSMLEFLGDMGGLIQIVFLVSWGIVAVLLERNFKAAIISDTFKVQKYHRDKTEYYQSSKEKQNKKLHKLTSESESSHTSSSESDTDSQHSNKGQLPNLDIYKS